MTDEKKTIDQYAADLKTLSSLSAPRFQMTSGDDRDNEYQAMRKLNYALDMIGHLLHRIEQLEARHTEA